MKEILKNARKYTVSKKKDAQIINELNNLRNIKSTPLLGDYLILLTNMIMSNYKKIGALVVALGLVAVVGLSGVFQGQTAFANHLENTEKALQELQVMQNEGTDTNEERVRELVQEIVRETNAALALAEGEEGEQKQKALQEVKEVQEKSMNMFKNFEGEAVAQALQEAEQNHERVREMLGDQTGEMVQEQTQGQNKTHSRQ